MTQRQAIAELQRHIDQCESQLLYYEENAPWHNNSAITTYKQALEIAVDAIKENVKNEVENSKSGYCEWKICSGAFQSYYKTSCGMIYGLFRDTDKYCARCGKEIVKI